MQPHILQYHQFYRSSLGLATARLIEEQILKAWPQAKGQTVVGLGYALPYLDGLRGCGAEAFAFMPAAQGVCHWPEGEAVRSVLVNPRFLPVADASIHKLLIVHGLEHSGKAMDVLREAWRVLAPDGELIVIAPNRRRIWSALDRTPFGFGHPFSKHQLTHMVADQMFTLLDASTILMLPPLHGAFGVRMLEMLERPMAKVGPGLGGVLMIRSVKKIYQVIHKGAPQRAARLGSFPVPLRPG